MQIILDYLNNPENKLYVIVLFVTLVLLILLSGLTVYAYKRKKHAAEITPFIPDKAMPEDIVETLDDMYAEATDDSAVEFEKNDGLDDKTLNKLEKIDIPDAIDRAADIEPNGIVVLENDGPDDELNEITVKSADDDTDEYESQPKPVGNWAIVTAPDGKLFARLETSDGEILLTTENYTSLSGLKSGIDTLKKNIRKDNYAVNIDKNGEFVFKVFTGDRILCISRGYPDRKPCENAFAKAKNISEHATTQTPRA